MIYVGNKLLKANSKAKFKSEKLCHHYYCIIQSSGDLLPIHYGVKLDQNDFFHI